jgi:hypothetical protein
MGSGDCGAPADGLRRVLIRSYGGVVGSIYLSRVWSEEDLLLRKECSSNSFLPS